MKHKIITICLLTLLALPISASAQDSLGVGPPDITGSESCSNIGTFGDFVKCIISAVVNPVIYLIGAAALLYFLYGVYKYIREADNETKRTEASRMIAFGIVALFVMISVWGLVNLVAGTFNFSDRGQPQIPTFKP